MRFISRTVRATNVDTMFVRICVRRVRMLLWIPWEEKHNNGCPDTRAHVPSPPFLACVPLVFRFGLVARKNSRGPSRSPLLLLLLSCSRPPYSYPSPFIPTAYISTAFVTRLRNNPLARHRKISGGGPADYIAGFMNKEDGATNFNGIHTKYHEKNMTDPCHS